jgi:ABC-type antimicrobial peptide transport system permease subunit
MTAAFLVLLWVQNEFSFDSYQPDADREYRVTWMSGDKTVVSDDSPPPMAAAAVQRIPGIEAATSYYPHGYDLPMIHLPSETLVEKNVIYADTSWFRLFHYAFIDGNAGGFGTENGIVLTAALASRYFGQTAVAGRAVEIDTVHYSILGVVQNNPVNSSFQFDLFLPLRARLGAAGQATAGNGWNMLSTGTFVRLKPRARASECEKLLTELIKASAGLKGLTAKLVPLREMHFGLGLAASDMVTGDRKLAVIFGCLGALLLVIACINYVNMATAKASLRVKEISMKKIMGASRLRLFGQLMMEALLTGTVALLLTLFLIWLALPGFNHFSEKHFVLAFSSPAVLSLLVGTWVLAIGMTGIYPAILLSGFDPLGMLRSERNPHARNTRVRKALVVVQFTAAIALILGTIIIYSQMHFIQQENNIYDKSQVFTIDLPSSKWFNRHAAGKSETMLDELKADLGRQSSIKEIAFVSGSMMEMPMSMSGIADWDGRDRSFNPIVYPVYIDPESRHLFGLQLVAGKWFTPGNPNDRHNYILNETAAASFGLHRPYVGQRFALMADTGRVIGIVKDFHFRSLHEEIAPVVLANNTPWRSILYVKASPHAIPGAIREASETFRRFFPDQPFEYTFLDDDFARIYRSDIKTSQLVGGFAGIAVFLSCLGLLGLAAFTAKQREKEIATRKVLGATVRHIVGHLSGGFLRLVLISLLLACPVGWWAMHKWLDSFAYRTPITSWMFALAGGFALAVAFLTIAAQAIRAATANPITSLRNP